MLMLDEAHATGVFGPHGRGVAEHALHCATSTPGKAGGCRPDRDLHAHLASTHIRVGTLSKALGSGGGFVCGTQSLIDWLANRARTYVFSTAQPPATSAAALAALDIARREPHRREMLLARAADLRSRLSSQGWNTGNSASQIIPLIIGDAKRTMELAAALRDAGFFIPGIRPPSVPGGESLLRLSLCYHHTAEIMDALVARLAGLVSHA